MGQHAVGRADELPIGSMKAFNAGGTRVVVYRLKDGFHATQAQCPHAFAPLGRGEIVDGCQVRCPLHRARFDIATGQVVEWANFPPGIQLANALRPAQALRTYPVKVKGGKIMVTT